MIECLSNSGWIEPQIDFLLFLQGIRENCPDIVNKLFLSITILGEAWFPTLICALVYWCVDFRAGVYLFSLAGLDVAFAQVFKMIACVYRPWVLSDKIQPVKQAFTMAGGYSFPSGHSAKASAVLGGCAYLVRKKKFVSLLLVLLVFLVGFSRMWLGVHTPQDVVVGLIIGFSLVFIMKYVLDWANVNQKRYLYLLILVDIFIISSLAYICYFNSYPIDYVNGKLLVNPYGSIKTTVICMGYITGILNGLYLTSGLYPFKVKEISKKTRVLRGIFGSILVILISKFGLSFVFANQFDLKIAFLIVFTFGIVITGVYPLIFGFIEQKLLHNNI